MKKIYSLFLISLFAKTIAAQTYYPLLDSINEWSYTAQMIGVRLSAQTQTSDCTYPLSCYNSFKQYTGQDSLINGHYYKPVFNNYYLCSMGFIREDTAARKVFFIDNLSPTEKVLYNFSMNVNDTMSIHFISFGAYVNGVYTLDSIKPITIHAGNRRAFYLSCHTSIGSPVLTWIESVGNLNDVLYPYFDNHFMPGYFNSCPGVVHQFQQFMICFDHNYKVYYDTCSLTMSQNNPCCATYSDSCDYYSFLGGIDETSSLSSMDIFPNPSNGKTTVSLDVKQNDNFEIIIHDISGKKILKEIALGKIPEGKKEIELDLSSLANGMYLVECKSENGSVYNKLLIAH